MKLSLFAMSTLFASQIANAENLVTNGSFEEDAVNSKWTLLDSVTGWQSEGARFEIQTSRLGIITAADGNQYIELDSTANHSVFQTLATEVGKTYEVSFYYSPRVTGNNRTNKVDVKWNGTTVLNLNATRRGWQSFTLSVEAVSSSSEIRFTGSGTNDSLGGFIDNVAVTEKRACHTGIFGINNYGSAQTGYVYKFDLQTNTFSVVAGAQNTASNIASHNGKLYFMEQLDKGTKASKLWSLDLETGVQVAEADAKSWPIYRSAVTASGQSLRATSKTYMYDYNLQTGEKTVLGKMRYSGDSFSHGDIAYSADNNTLYVLTGKSLYSIDESSMELTLIGHHGINWASGLAISDSGTLYVSGRVSGENAKIYTVNAQTAVSTYVMDAPEHINDLTFVDNYCN
ncbi:DUF642 domain-containing protein [Pseudoalteromonas luteoviolacea]|uniref:DUF642 domain-containing protein n=1 Tax=Pseudoalteromonas luteoviolacea S4054 TaxID=1129367 RepID=A0A0F6A532_9GAMM|nr:DUF642 domain-containing protein [Pseudoalteromonas luteoviolacea]AOT07562.1 hemolysin-type calcium-binding protein [Pseudoalteromonas luteoviolacea]AOT12478.1 hemolysin-type calcium-binding protein [Pseudoalteromonas luteoviolacea]AOT17392.1 hemolysin-type calcium-binding protein [Pseudoalteromonas luteoviolacea]KKE81297.1 hypothetical protein N479_22440 [Pseudoalteromonas luteoviolacea S4054]KZN70694.1 hypothetical protein N481_20995 [Pseudoalteromonas luteoviolacea S4047-1]